MISELIINKGIYNNIDVMENTLESFKEAFSKGYSVKTKVQILKDNTFILLEDDALERVFNLKDNIKSMTYDDLEYISKYDILKLKDILTFVLETVVILEVSSNSKKILKMLFKELDGYQANFIILSKNMKVLKFFRKNKFRVMLKIDKRNKRWINSNFKIDNYCLENGLFDRKVIRKIREQHTVIGFGVTKYDDLNTFKEIFDKIIIDF